jgi:hypothetical protein
MRDDDRQRVLMSGPHVDEVNVDSVDRRDELRQGVQLRFHLAPVVAAPPVLNQLLQLRQLRALRLIADGFLIGPSRSSNAPAEVIERRLRHLDFERADRWVVGWCAPRRRLGEDEAFGSGSGRGLPVAREGKDKKAQGERGRRDGRKTARRRHRRCCGPAGSTSFH